MYANLLAAFIGVVYGLAFYVVAKDIGSICSYQRVGGMRFVRFGPVSASFCLTRKPVRKVVQ